MPESTAFVPRTLAEVAAKTGTPSFWEQKYNLWAGLFGGFFLLDCESRDQAIALAAECPAARFATVEVRELGPCYT